MKILVLEGSPNRHGSSNMLAEKFSEGAKESGHEVTVVSVVHSNIHPCNGCVSCGYDGPCVQQDDMQQIGKELLEADMLVIVTPLYYYGMSAQMKTAIDRFCAYNGRIQRKHMKSAIISTAWNSDHWTFEALDVHYKTLVKYLNFDSIGEIYAEGCGTPSMTKQSRYMQMAYNLGKRLI